MAAIANHLAAETPALVLSETPGSASHEPMKPGQPAVIEIRNRIPEKAALAKDVGKKVVHDQHRSGVVAAGLLWPTSILARAMVAPTP